MTGIKLSIAALVLTFIVVVVGAYVRLSDAGLSCPDWPGCYGYLLAPTAESTVAIANEAFPGQPVHVGKAWKEMVHRYLAGLLGIIILSLAIFSLRPQGYCLSRPLTWFLVVLVLAQATLGMLTVTMLLKPIIVTGHLLGGLTTLALVTWLSLSALNRPRTITWRPIRPLIVPVIALVILYLQIGSGGWTSTNYAALACPDFPTCHGSYWPAMDLKSGFNFEREVGRDANGSWLGREAMTAIHWVHRLGALVTVLVIGGVSLFGWMRGEGWYRVASACACVLLLFQVILGVGMVMWARPLLFAAGHNAVAALLLIVVTAQLFFRGLSTR